MNVLMINGSPHKEGNTWLSLKEMEKIFKENGIESELFMLVIRPFEAALPAVHVPKTESVCLMTVSMNWRQSLKNVMGWLLQVLCIMLRPTEQWFLFWIDCFLVHHLIKR